jgi:hypothetical protein
LSRRASAPPMESFTTHPRDQRPAVVADANALIADSVRRARGLFSLMPFLAERKLINLLTAEHIDAKVYERLPEVCEHCHVDLADAVRAYEMVHRPLLRFEVKWCRDRAE